MRKLTIIVLLIVMTAVPVAAFSPRDSYLDTISAIAWSDGLELNVAIGNTANTRTTVTISTTTVDAWGRRVFASRQVNLLGRTIVLETFYPATPRRNEPLTVQISDGYRSINVPVQITDIMEPESYIVEANTHWTVDVDLDLLLQDSDRTRLIIDDYYETADGYNRDRIRVDSIQGGPSQVRGSNTIEYVRPFMVLTMKTPQVTGLTTITFGIRKTDDTSSWRDELIQGPIAFVYGRNMRYVGPSTGSGRTSR